MKLCELCSILTLLSLILLSISAKQVNYHGYRIYRVFFEPDDDVEYLLNLSHSTGEIRLLKFFKHEGVADVLVSPRKERELLDELESGDLDNFNLLNENIQEEVHENEEFYEIMRSYRQRLFITEDMESERNNTQGNKTVSS